MHKFYKKLYEEIGNDQELLEELISDFITIYEDNIEELTRSINQINYKRISFIAHKLKGSSMNFTMPKFTEAAQELEDIGKEELKKDLVQPFNKMKKEYNAFLQAKKEL
jgi:HPt (histidine-containing phosphotransfer) domain-containing protein